MKSALLEHARLRHQSPSEFVRAALADAIGAPEHCRDDQAPTSSRSTAGDRVRLSLRMSRCEARRSPPRDELVLHPARSWSDLSQAFLRW
jgi:hypothetical protein